jgi:hypothetical protein
MTRKSDYKIISYYNSFDPNVEKFQIIHGGKTYSTYRTYQEAVNAVNLLIKDSWFFDRGYTRKDRLSS